MEEKRFTPGPWHWDEEGLGNKNIIVFGKEYPAEMTSKANKALISSAPELLDALQCLFDDYKELADSGDAGNWRVEDLPAGKKALQAIAKALGKE